MEIQTGAFMAPHGAFVIDISATPGGSIIDSLRAVWACAPPSSDFGGDGLTDLAVYRPSAGRWYVKDEPQIAWGLGGDLPVPGQYDPDPGTERAVFRPSNGRWYIRGRSDSIAWGVNGDFPVPGDYDADTGTDIAVFRPSNGRWYIRGGAQVAWGLNGDIPVPGQYDTDAETDIAVFRPSTGRWYIHGTLGSTAWGLAGDIPLPGDYDGDGTTDIAVFRPSNGRWYIHGGAQVAWGLNGDIPVPGQYDTDAETDIAVFRPSTGRWYIHGTLGSTAWGLAGDIPAPLPAAIVQSYFSFVANNETSSANEADYCNLQFPLSMDASAGAQTDLVYGQLYEAGLTESAGPPLGVIAQIGWGPDGSDPLSSAQWTWANATWNRQAEGGSSNNDEFVASFTAPSAPGTYDYTYRFSLDGGATATYCDTNGAGSGAELTFDGSADLGELNVTP